MEKKPISFALLAKEEAARFPRSDEEKRALLSAFIRINGYLRLTKGDEGMELQSESASIAKAIYQYLHELYGVEPHFAYTRSAGFLKRVVYHVLVGKEAEDILNDLQVDFFAPSFPKSLLASPSSVAAYLSGAFLAAGSVNDPVSSNYHLEIALSDEGYRQSAQQGVEQGGQPPVQQQDRPPEKTLRGLSQTERRNLGFPDFDRGEASLPSIREHPGRPRFRQHR
jgi:DNA-binding protein WhiA